MHCVPLLWAEESLAVPGLSYRNRPPGVWKKGFHANTYKASENQLDCARCHGEHNGCRSHITRLDRASFDHAALTGFSLQGKHSSLMCENCHKAELVGVQAGEIKMKDLNRSFLGLPTACAVCHKDVHNGELGANCTGCHTQEAWKPAPGFDHRRTSYPLTGKHASVECTDRAAAGQSLVNFRGLRFASCDNCHLDPHRGAFQNASGWKALKTDVSFDHGRTRFPLTGAHAGLDCFKCHPSTDFSQKIPHEACGDCHKDIHGGQFSNRRGGSDCAACHNDRVFKPSLFTRDEHQKSRFPLEGKHAAVDCTSCHKPAGPDTKWVLDTQPCQGCHSDPHQGAFASEPYSNRCEACHTQSQFHPSTFSLSRHQETKFALTGAHVALACADCHKPSTNAASAADRTYHFADTGCTACHLDPHQIPAGRQLTCEGCHNTQQWKAVRLFDHNQTRFKLEGAHANVACIGCHRPECAGAASGKIRTISLAALPTVCHERHEDVHAGQFLQPGDEKDCTFCHTLTTWSSGIFDHDRTAFPLDGAHREVKTMFHLYMQIVPKVRHNPRASVWDRKIANG